MIQDFILHSTPKEELANIIREVLKTELANITPQQENNSVKFYSRREVAKMLNISLPTLHEWTKNGVITAHRINTRIRFKHSDIEKALQEIETLKYSRKK